MPGERDLMTTAEVAEYLRLKERKIYDLVQKGKIPCTRVTGKWLFPKEEIDAWLRAHTEGVAAAESAAPPPPVLAGSHDVLLEWAVRSSGCGLATAFESSLAGLDLFAAGDAVATGLHLRDPDTGEYNRPWAERRFSDQPVVLLRWASRQQGLILPKGGRPGIADLRSALDAGLTVATRQAGSGTRVLFDTLAREAGHDPDAMAERIVTARSQTELAHHVTDGSADIAFGIAAATAFTELAFVPLMTERFDLLIRRRDYFEPAFQTLMDFTRRGEFADYAAKLPGYDAAELGAVVWNA